jgi:prepilin signal peptidase PulO-like enzyme (type II secretory pathway)
VKGSETWVFDQSRTSGTVPGMHTHPLPTPGEGILAAGFAVTTGGLVLAFLLALATPIVALVARRRVVAQPLEHHPDAERRIVDSVITSPSLYVYVHQLRSEHFVDEDLGAIWAVITEHNHDVEMPSVPSDETAAYELLETVGVNVPQDLREHLEHLLRDGALTATTADRLNEMLTGADATDAQTDIAREELVEIASRVYNAGIDRYEYAGSARIERTGDRKRPLRRVPSRLTPLRTLIAAGLLAVGGLVAGSVAETGESTAAQVAIAAALTFLTVGSVIWTLVDLETMYVDMPSFYVLAGASWLSALLAAWFQDALGQAVTGLLVVAGIVLFIEAINQAYRRIRGRHGMGMGDYLLVLATIGVPVALTGSLMLGQVILIVSLLAGIVGWTFSRLTRPGFTRETPYAFGPYLASGWVVGLLLWGVGG